MRDERESDDGQGEADTLTHGTVLARVFAVRESVADPKRAIDVPCE